jgi:hypothetical protein
VQARTGNLPLTYLSHSIIANSSRVSDGFFFAL